MRHFCSQVSRQPLVPVSHCLKHVQTDTAHVFCRFVNRQQGVPLTGSGYVLDIERMDTFNKSALPRYGLYATDQQRIRGGRGPSIQQCVLTIRRLGCSQGPVP